jgi:DNA polymerase III subunit alpha
MRSAKTLAEKGVQPIVGCLLSVDLDEAAPTVGCRRARSRLQSAAAGAERSRLSQSHQAAQCRLSRREPGDWPHVTADLLAAHAEGLIALTGGPGGPLNRLLVEGQPEAAARCSTGSGDVRRPALCGAAAPRPAEERATEDRLLDLAYERALPLVATNDVHFGRAEMYEAHDALLCIADGTFVSQEDRRRLTREHRFKSPAEMAAQFADLPEAIENTIEIAKRCASGPRSAIPSCRNSCRNPACTPAEELRAQAEAGLRAVWRFMACSRTSRSIATGSPSSSASSSAWISRAIS